MSGGHGTRAISRALPRWLLLSVGLCSWGCEDRKNSSTRSAGVTEPSPNATILPAPLASGIEAVSASKPSSEETEHRDAGHPLLDAGADETPPEPHSLRDDQSLPGDTPHESSGLSLTARLRSLESGATARLPEQNTEGTQRARDATEFELVIDLAGGRMRWAFASRAFTLPPGSELHARDDLYGYSLLWPNRTIYTVLQPGTLRSVLAQQRADVMPLVRARFAALTPGSLMTLRTERAEVVTPIGRLELEQARAPNPGASDTVWASGQSLCRLLIELLGAIPNHPVCRSDLVPLRAEFTWANGERFSFEVSRLQRRTDFNPSALAMPPAGAEFRQSELPAATPNALLSDNELSELRLRAAPRTERLDPSAPKTGLLVVNHFESLRYVIIDGAPAARLLPGAEQLLLGLRPGRYQIAARDFFGGEDAVLKVVEVPARFILGEEVEKAH